MFRFDVTTQQFLKKLSIVLVAGLFVVGVAANSAPKPASAQAPSNLCGNEPEMAKYYKVPHPARASSAARSLMSCILFNVSAADKLLINFSKIYTYQEDINFQILNYTRGVRDCGITDLTCEASRACHAVYSCHYGGKTGTDGAEGVDYNANNSNDEDEVYNILKNLVYPGGACHGLAKYIGLEGNHTHLSTNTDAGCDSVNIPGVVVQTAGVTTTTVTGPITVPGASSVLPSPISCKTVTCLLVGILKIVLAVLGIFGTFMFVYGGFLFLSSGGNVDMVRKAKSTLVYSTLGMVIVLASWIIVSTVFKATVAGKL